MKRISFPLLLFVAHTYVPDAVAAIDQQYVPATTNSRANVGDANAIDSAQTFTVGTTGTFTGFDIWVTRDAATTLPLLFDIRRTSGGVPTEPDVGSNILVAGSIDASQFVIHDGTFGPPPGSIPHVELNELSFPVVAGDVLAIALRSDAPSITLPPSRPIFAYGWHGYSVGEYANGAAYFRTSAAWRLSFASDLVSSGDRVFRTYVTAIPEPSNVLLFMAAAASIAVTDRHVRRCRLQRRNESA